MSLIRKIIPKEFNVQPIQIYMINKREECIQILELNIFVLDVTDLFSKAYKSSLSTLPWLKTYTTPLQPGPIWMSTYIPAPGHSAFLMEIDSSVHLYSVYITSQVIVLSFSMLTMFPRSVSVEQAKENIWKFIIFPPIYLTPTFGEWTKAYCQVHRPGQKVTVCSSQAQRDI